MAKEVSSLKKAYCPHCKTNNDLERIFTVSPDAEVCYCPNCLREYKPKEVIDNYNYYIANRLAKAERLLYRDTKFYEAYCAFGDIIEIDSTISKARFGRILSLIFMSKLRKTQFENAALLLNTEAEQYFHKLKDQIPFIKFLNRANAALDEYSKRLYKKITIKDRFYSEDCVALYFQHLHEVIEMKKIILDEFQKIWTKNAEARVEHQIKSIEESLKEMNDNFNSEVVTTEGVHYKVAKVIPPKQILVSALSKRTAKLNHYVKYKLDDNEKRGKLLKDNVYPDNIHIKTMTTVAYPLMILFYILAVASLLMGIFSKNNEYDLFFYIGAGGFLLVAIIWTILFIVWKAKLAKRNHLID